MSERRSGSTTPGRRAIVLAIVASVALAGVGTFVVGGSSATRADGPADRSPYPGKEVTPDDATANETACPPEEDLAVETGTDDATANGTDASGYQLQVDYEGEWRGTIVTEDTDIPIEGSGSETIDIEAGVNERVAASVAKSDISSETLAIRLLLNGEVIDEQNPAEPDVDNFDRTGGSTVGETSTGSTFGSASDTTTGSETGSDGWETFGEANGSSFESSSEDPFADEDNTSTDETVTASDDPFGDETTNETATALEPTNDTDAADDTATAEECEPAEDDTTEAIDDATRSTSETTEKTNDTNTTNDTAFPATTSGSAQVVFDDQATNEAGTNATVESATLPDGGFVVIHDASLMNGSVEESVIGVSEELDAGGNRDIEVALAERIEESQTLYAVLYRDTDDDGNFEFSDTGETGDEPYLNDSDMAVFDDATVTVPGADSTDATADTSVFGNESDATTTTAGAEETADAEDESVVTDTRTATVTPTAADDGSAAAAGTETASVVSTSTAMSGEAAGQSTETNAPGFGMGVAIVALLGIALLATRRS